MQEGEGRTRWVHCFETDNVHTTRKLAMAGTRAACDSLNARRTLTSINVGQDILPKDMLIQQVMSVHHVPFIPNTIAGPIEVAPPRARAHPCMPCAIYKDV
jgi:hypothetical protein